HILHCNNHRQDNHSSPTRRSSDLRNGQPVLAEAYGLSDREHRTPNKLNTRFRIGSMNKMFTATATLQLVQAGKLALNDPLGKYRSEEHTSELQSLAYLVCRLLLEK